MICAGRVLSQPPITTTASIGCARIISSVSIAIRLRRYIEVGCAKLSWIEMVGNTIGMRARQHHAALDRLDDLRHVAVAGIVVAVGVGDADDRPVQRVVGIAHRLDEGLAQEQRKAGVAIAGQSFAQSVGHFHFFLLSFRSNASGPIDRDRTRWRSIDSGTRIDHWNIGSAITGPGVVRRDDGISRHLPLHDSARVA